MVPTILREFRFQTRSGSSRSVASVYQQNFRRYDDGDSEQQVSESYIRSAPQTKSSAGARGGRHDATLAEGDSVEGNFEGKGT